MSKWPALASVAPAYVDDICAFFIGDSFDVLAKLEAEGFFARARGDARAHVITDPPYDEHTHSKMLDDTGSSRALDFAHIDEEAMRSLSIAFARASTGWVAVFCADTHAVAWRHALAAQGVRWRRRCLWVKTSFMPKILGDGPAQADESFVVAWAGKGNSVWNGGGKGNVWTGPRDTSTFHATQKPAWLMESIIDHFTQRGDLVIDPFAGSGTTGVAAKKLGRRVVLIERDEAMARKAIARIAAQHEQMTIEIEASKMKQVALSFDDAPAPQARAPRRL